MPEIKLTNSLTRKKEVFTPIKPNELELYVCGITPYDYSHLGHGRSSVNFDILVRLFKFIGFKVFYVRNFTDIDDKIINRAEKEFGDIDMYPRIAKKFIEHYHLDMRMLGNIKPEYEPRVTDYIPQIINFIKKLVASDKAYIIDSDVYFDISKFPDYGKLSGRKVDEQQAGARIEIDSRKRNVEDFVLWKGNSENKFWKSPWGYGRPGWHIECSVMANELLGDTIDIHGGGMDLIFPHHENEIAQSEAFSCKPFANFWLHNAFITINKEKMSKSLGNFVTLKDIFNIYDPMILRYFFLQHNYRTPIDFSDDELKSSQTAYKKLINALSCNKQECNLSDVLKDKVSSEILSALCDDLNTPKAIGIIFESLSVIKENMQTCCTVRTIVKNILGLSLDPIQSNEIELSKEAEQLIHQRELARKNKDWNLADKIRDELKKMGYEVKDKKN